MKKRVIVALSGGVDSAVAASILVDQGYDVVGVFAMGWSGNADFPCDWQSEEADARSVAQRLGIEFQTINLSEQYEKQVINYFLDEYRQGRTPNPDVLCNSEIKFKALWHAMRGLEPQFLATGHYAKISRAEKPIIVKPKDTDKDQTYFLWNIDKAIPPKLIFPLGDLTKTEVRRIAKQKKLPVFNKKDSQGVCFVGPLKVREFLASQLNTKAGDVILKDGRVVAKHDGVLLYTIGQRLRAGTVKWTGDVPPLYVIKKDLANNTLVVGSNSDLYSKTAVAHSANWFVTPPLELVKAQTRYRGELVDCRIEIKDEVVKIAFAEPVRAVTPGQSIVFYNKDSALIGGAIITT